MERPASHGLPLVAENLRGARHHLLRRASGEGQKKDRLGGHARLDELYEAMDERVGLPCPRARDDEDGSFENLGRPALRRI